MHLGIQARPLLVCGRFICLLPSLRDDPSVFTSRDLRTVWEHWSFLLETASPFALSDGLSPEWIGAVRFGQEHPRTVCPLPSALSTGHTVSTLSYYWWHQPGGLLGGWGESADFLH